MKGIVLHNANIKWVIPIGRFTPITAREWVPCGDQDLLFDTSLEWLYAMDMIIFSRILDYISLNHLN